MPAHPCRVLIAEDDRDTAESLALLFDIDGFETEVVTDGAVVFTAVRAARPSVVILDLRLPRLSGVEVARQLRTLADDERPRVVVVSGTAYPGMREELEHLGVDAFFLKPADPVELVACVRRLCGTA